MIEQQCLKLVCLSQKLVCYGLTNLYELVLLNSILYFMQVWRGYTCQVSSTGICITVGRISPDIYNQMTVAVNISFALYHYSPFLVGLQDCTFVRDTFAYVSRKNCPGLRLYTEWIYIGLLMVSAAVMLSLIFWIIHARERRRRKYSAQLIQSDEFQAKGS